jgi:class 3 adenylate cyclase
LTDSVGTGDPAALRQIKALRRAAAAREDYGQSLGRLLPAAVADRLRADPGAFGRSTRLMVTVLVSDVRGYTALVGDTVNLAQRLQDLARPAGTTLLSAATARALSAPPGFGSRECVSLGLVSVKGRVAPVEASRSRYLYWPARRQVTNPVQSVGSGAHLSTSRREGD